MGCGPDVPLHAPRSGGDAQIHWSCIGAQTTHVHIQAHACFHLSMHSEKGTVHFFLERLFPS